jgi:3-dehydroquinate synthase
MTPIRLIVQSERTRYPVLIGAGLSRQLPRLLRAHGLDGQRLVVSAAPIWRRHGARLHLTGADAASRPALIADGERAKTLDTVARLYDACLARALDRSAVVIAVGGGVVGDTAGFAAASYLRGIRLVQVPTTLLSQVDSSVGGKVGVNLPAGKNLVGAFHPASLVVCDPEVLATLSRRELRSGLYEVVKYGVIASRALFTRVARDLDAIVACDPDVLTPIVAACCRIKARGVAADEREGGLRRILNFGHTIGHALEALTHYRRFRHGEAIGYGMLAAARLSVARGTMTPADQARLAVLIARMGALPPVDDLDAFDALDVIAHDKKVVRGRLHFVLAAGIGRTTIAADVRPRELVAAMRHIGLRAGRTTRRHPHPRNL